MEASDRLAEMLTLQRDLQVGSYGTDLLALEGEARIESIRNNVLALTDELHEVLGETGWKPWATSRHVDEANAVEEWVDAWHFMMNLLLVIAPRGLSIDDVAGLAYNGYVVKRTRNAERQAEGYTGEVGGAEHDAEHVKPMQRVRSIVSFWCEPGVINLNTFTRKAGYEPASYQFHTITREGGTHFVEASYTARGANAAQIRRFAAKVAQACGVNIQEHDVTLVRTIETVLLEAAGASIEEARDKLLGGDG